MVLGPGSIDQAHTEDEWVPMDEVRGCQAIVERIARAFGAGGAVEVSGDAA